jgi:hypothetical protein
MFAQHFIDLLGSYFADQTRDEGLAEIISVSSAHDAFHVEFMEALDAAIAAAAKGDRSVLDPVRERFLRYRRDDDAIRAFLDDFRSEYLRLHAQAVIGRS